MEKFITKKLLMLLLVFITGALIQLHAQNKNASPANCFSPKANNLSYLSINQTFQESRSITPFTAGKKIYSLALSLNIALDTKASLVRVILVDENAVEYLVYETYPLIANSNSLSITDLCEETSILNGVVPMSLQIQTINSTVAVKNIAVSYAAPNLRYDEINALRQQLTDAQNDAKIETINRNNKMKGINWIAGRTDVSHLLYNQKKLLINTIDGYLNLQGFEYYNGGIFEYDLGFGEESTTAESPSALTDHWDWRERHGANKVGSPYYDGDAKKGGWFTAIQNQKCNQCWAFAPTAAIEVLTNLYFNQHLNIDLSEQCTAACGGGASGECEGGNSSASANYIATTGIVNEACLPYANTDAVACSKVCANPVDKIKAGGRVSLGSPNEATMQKYIMDYGPVTSGVNGMWHFMCLEGFFKDAGKNVWIFKNSWGAASGDNGFANIKITGSGTTDKLYGNFAFKTPITSLQRYEVICNDKDGDGYCWWGIGTKPATTCPTCPAEADADDSDPCIGPLDANYNGTPLNGPKCISNVNEHTKNTIALKVFPNPTNGAATISYALPKKASIRLSIVNLLGEEVLVLLDNQEVQEGPQLVKLDNLAAGVFFCKLSYSNNSFISKIIVVK